MGFAEKKVELLKIVADADEELTGKLIEFAKQLVSQSKYSQEDLEKFHNSRQTYLQNQQNTISLKDAHSYIRSLKKK